MLRSLSFKDFITLKSATFRFGNGFNVITGETGAGKSAVVKGLRFLLGGRSIVDQVRHNCDYAEISCVFELTTGHPALLTSESIGAPCTNRQLHIKRRLNRRGRSVAWINDIQVTLPSLRKIAGPLADLCDQHGSVALFEAPHLDIIDTFDDRLRLKRQQYEKAFQEAQAAWCHVEEIFSRCVCGISSEARDQAEACLQLNPSSDDYAELLAKCSNMDKAREFGERMRMLDSLFEAPQSGQTIDELLSTWLRGDDNEHGPTFALFRQTVEDTRDHLRKCRFDLQDMQAEEDYDETEHDAVQSRLAGYQALMRRLKVQTPEELETEANRLAGNSASHAEALSGLLLACETALDLVKKLPSLAKELTTQRYEVVATLEEDVSNVLTELDMKRSSLEVKLRPAALVALPALEFSSLSEFEEGVEASSIWEELTTKLRSPDENGRILGKYGFETAKFFLRTGTGPSLPIAQVASGGEASRIFLAIRSIGADGPAKAALVFDEVDAGISGRVAHTVARKLTRLASSMQVICVSHLPQIAAYARVHFRVDKIYSNSGLAMSELSCLAEEDDKVEEIARLLSGSSITNFSRENARSLLHEGQAVVMQ